MKGKSIDAYDAFQILPRHSYGASVKFGEELPQFAGTIYKKVRRISFTESSYVVSNCGCSAEILLIADHGVPIEEARVERAWR